MTVPLFNPGVTIRLSISVRDITIINKPLIDPSSLTFRVTSPGGTVTNYVYGIDVNTGRISTGKYYLDLLTDPSGLWSYEVESAGPGTVQGGEQGTFRVALPANA